jgi:hypothetical protein
MNNHDRSDRDICQRRRRRGAYAAVLSAAVGAGLAAAMIPAAPAFADPAGDAAAAAAGDAVPAAMSRGGEEATLNNDISTLFDDLHLSFLAGPDVQTTDFLLGLLPGGAGGTDAVAEETALVTDITPLLDEFGGGGMKMFDAAAADAALVIGRPTEEAVLNNDITTYFDDLHLPFLAGPDVQTTDFLLGLLPGGVNGTDAVAEETALVADITPVLDAFGGGGAQMLDLAALLP